MIAHFILTIDGPAGVGKSTLAKRTAGALGVAYLDTGAMFRTLALAVEKNGKELRGHALTDFLQKFAFALEGVGAGARLLCNGRVVGDEVRSEEAGMAAARLAVLPEAREVLKDRQRDIGETADLVAEGRDMGTAIFPSAARKIFLDARPLVRAERRAMQLAVMGQHVDIVDLAERIRERDDMDRNRVIAPLRPAPDATIIDTSDLSVDEVFAKIMETIGRRPE